MPLSNLRTLRDGMCENEKAVVVFRFHYKELEYFVAVSTRRRKRGISLEKQRSLDSYTVENTRIV